MLKKHWRLLEKPIERIKLFRISNSRAIELRSGTADLEKSLQNLIEANLETLLGIRFIETEYSTGKTHAGRIDSLGIDEDNCPVIIEYKRHRSENVINQGLFYLDWLMDHQAEFQLLVMDRYGSNLGNEIDWSSPRLICIASDFTKYDSHAVQQMNRNIELVRYKQFDDDLFLLELVNAVVGNNQSTAATRNYKSKDKPVSEALRDASPKIHQLYEELESFITSLGDDVQKKELKLYFVFKRLKNFACVVVQKKKLLIMTRLDPDQVGLEEGFTRDVRQIGHWGTGDLEISITSTKELSRAKELIRMSYEGT